MVSSAFTKAMERSERTVCVGDIPAELTVHYVSQEVNIEEERLEWSPVQFVVHADVERRLLLQEEAELQVQQLRPKRPPAPV